MAEAKHTRSVTLEQALGPDLSHLARSQWPIEPDPWAPEELAEIERIGALGRRHTLRSRRPKPRSGE